MESKMKMALFSILIVTTLTGCQTMMYGKASDLEKLSPGMTKAQVIDTIGSPVATSFDGEKNEEHLLFKKMKGVISWEPKVYDVTFRDGKVLRWGEQYEAKVLTNY